MKQQNNNIEKLFKDKFQNFEADPGANAWANVQTRISSNAAASAATTTTSWASSAILGVVITAVAISGYLFFNNEGKKKIQPQQTETEETTSVTEIELSIELQEEISTNKEAFKGGTEDNLNQPSEIEDAQVQTKKEREGNNNSINTEETSVDGQSDEVTSKVEEKTIDQILAEHQQFLDEQAAANANRNAELGDSERETTIPVKSENKEKAEVKEKNFTSSSENQLTEEARIKAEQKKIADQIVFPNVFSPDLDGTNDMFKMMVDQSIPIDNIQVSIVDINGKIVGGYTGIYEGWDGRMPNGNLAPAGWYTYQAIIYTEGKRIPKINGFNVKR